MINETLKTRIREGMQLVNTSPEGFTTLIQGGATVHGKYVVAFTNNVPDALNSELVEKLYEQAKRHGLHTSRLTLGGWRDASTGLYYLDIGTVVSTEREALKIARLYGQKAYYDLVAQVTVNAVHV